MFKPVLRFFRRSSLVMVEAVAVTIGLAVLLGALFMWRLSAGPLDVSFAKSYVEEALRDVQAGYSVRIDSAQLTWPELKGPLVLRLGRVDLLYNQQPLAQVGGVEVGVSRRALLLGKVQPVNVSLTAPALRLVRTADNDLHFVLSQGAVTQEESGPLSGNPLEYMLTALSSEEESLRSRRGPLARLRSFAIHDARMVIEDHIMGISWYIKPIDLMFARDREGLAITASLVLPGGGGKQGKVNIDAMFNRTQKRIVANLALADFNPHIVSHKVDLLSFLNDQDIVVNGNVALVTDQALTLEKLDMNLSAGRGQINLPEYYDAPLPFTGIDFTASYDHAGKILENAALTLRMDELQATFAATLTLEKEKVSGPVTLTVPEISAAALARLWPKHLDHLGAKPWIKDKMSGGRFVDGTASLDLTLTRKAAAEGGVVEWVSAVANMKAGIGIENMDVNYNRPMVPMTDAGGKARYEDDTLHITLDRGGIGQLSIKEADIKVTNLLADTAGFVTIDTRLGGSLQSGFHYLQQEPIAFDLVAAGIDKGNVQGDIDFDILVTFPALRDLPKEKVSVKAQGSVRNMLLPRMIKGLDVSGGPMNVQVEKGEIHISGTPRIAGRDTKTTLHAFTSIANRPYVLQVKSDLVADPELRRAFGAELPEWVRGDLPVNVVYTDRAGDRTDIDVTADVGPVAVMVAPFAYEKPVGVEGTAKAHAVLDKGVLKEISDLAIDTPDLNVQKGTLGFTQVKGEAFLSHGSFKRVVLKETDVNMTFNRGTDEKLRIAMTGPFLDARSFLGKGGKDYKPYTGPAVEADVNVRRMRVNPGGVVEATKIYADMNAKGDLNRFEMDSTVGDGPLKLRYRPSDSGLMTIFVEAADAGATLRAFNVYENMKGGKLVLNGRSVNGTDQRNVLRGNGNITDFNVVKAPILARLLGAMSITGIPELLGNQGIFFARLEADFDWVVQRQGDIYYMRDGRTSGSSVGLTFQGRVDKVQDEMNINGTIIPASMLNEIISNIPILGTLLTGGGESALIAATYTVKGPSQTPTVTVNPLSVLAPGFLRRVFFEEDVKDKATPGEGRAPPEAKQPEPPRVRAPVNR